MNTSKSGTNTHPMRYIPREEIKEKTGPKTIEKDLGNCYIPGIGYAPLKRVYTQETITTKKGDILSRDCDFWGCTYFNGDQSQSGLPTWLLDYWNDKPSNHPFHPTR